MHEQRSDRDTPSGPGPARLGRKLDLSRATGTGETDGSYLWTAAEGLTFRLQFPHGRRAVVNLSTEAAERPDLARELASTLWNSHWRGAGLDSAGLVTKAAGACRSLLRFLFETDPARRVCRLADLAPRDLALYLEFLEPMPTAQGRRLKAKYLLRVLRLASRWTVVQPSVVAYHLPVDRWRSGGYDPRDPYSPYVAGQLYAAARADFEAAVDRIEVVGPEMLRVGRDPRLEPRGWDRPENLVWYLANVQLSRYNALTAAGFRGESSVTKASSFLVPTTRDLLAFAIIMGLETGVPPGSLEQLAPDCLANSTGSFVDLLYRKPRALGEGVKSVGVRADLPFSPGWMVGKMRMMTERARSLACGSDRDFLLLALRPRGSGPNAVGNTLIHLRNSGDFCTRHGILDDAGTPLGNVLLSRLRKTHFSENYRALKGNIRAAAAASSNSPAVASAHYARVPAHAEKHEATVRSGLELALRSALDAAEQARRADVAAMTIAPQVLGDEEVSTLRADPRLASSTLGVMESVAGPLLDGELDVWLAGCKDISASPFGSPDGFCRVPLWGCMSCRNAVITSAKLPAILTLLEEILQARQRMDLESWASRLGATYLVIMKGVLPRFPPEQIMEAWAALSRRDVLPMLSSVQFRRP